MGLFIIDNKQSVLLMIIFAYIKSCVDKLQHIFKYIVFECKY